MKEGLFMQEKHKPHMGEPNQVGGNNIITAIGLADPINLLHKTTPKYTGLNTSTNCFAHTSALWAELDGVSLFRLHMALAGVAWGLEPSEGLLTYVSGG